jgi:hypothetical protein
MGFERNSDCREEFREERYERETQAVMCPEKGSVQWI